MLATKTHKHMASNVALDFQQVLREFVHFTSNRALLQQMVNQQEISTQVFQIPIRHATNVEKRITSAITDMNDNSYDREYELFNFIYKPTTDRKETQKRTADPGDTKNDTPTKKPKPTNKSSDPDKGLIKLAAGARINTFPDILAKHQVTNGLTRICAHFITLGQSCKWGKGCNKCHFSSISQLEPASARSQFRTAVANDSNLTWVNAADATEG